MKKEIQRFIDEYERKRTDCDKLLEAINKEISIARRNEKDDSDLRQERMLILAKQQAYIQRKADFDSLLDYAEV
ncbi:hypothetical protein A3715_28345 [Oleiphilus sp. HI0009]|nr:hypothetical protein A3715_10510 [Oleiphilus sp. HI0009]KZX85346.1 hypothetical protein A3715_28345 [Oleiphilus sp. HI0009]